MAEGSGIIIIFSENLRFQYMIVFRYGIISLFCVIGITISSTFGSETNSDQLPDVLENHTYDPDIHTVWLGYTNWSFSLPVIELNTEQKLELRFDDLSGESRSFGYTLIHCDMNWQRSPLSENEYMGGFGSGIIRESEASLNTTYFYINYSLVIPNDDVIPLVSGNYVLVVFDESDPENIILTRRFFVLENTMEIEARVSRPPFGDFNQTGQQLHFSVKYNNGAIRDPKTEITALALQNYRFDVEKKFDKPYLNRPGLLEYTDPDGGIFNAGNEFRTLDIKSMRYQTENIAKIDFRNPYYHVIMKTDNLRANKPWFSRSDLNGSYYIDKEKSNDRHTESDYIFVHFRLELPSVNTLDKVYVSGSFNDWKADSGSILKFNPDNGLFETTLLMKQGLYDYCYMMKDPGTGVVDEYEIEGSYYETENDYTIFVYFHDRFKGYDRLTGYLSIK